MPVRFDCNVQGDTTVDFANVTNICISDERRLCTE